jgi:hypothetical protein
MLKVFNNLGPASERSQQWYDDWLFLSFGHMRLRQLLTL